MFRRFWGQRGRLDSEKALAHPSPEEVGRYGNVLRAKLTKFYAARSTAWRRAPPVWRTVAFLLKHGTKILNARHVCVCRRSCLDAACFCLSNCLLKRVALSPQGGAGKCRPQSVYFLCWIRCKTRSEMLLFVTEGKSKSREAISHTFPPIRVVCAPEEDLEVLKKRDKKRSSALCVLLVGQFPSCSA